MPTAEWGAEPEFFGPRHAHREQRILRAVRQRPCVPSPHLECAAGVGSLSHALAADGRTVVAADRSLRSLAVLRRRSRAEGAVLPVAADINALPFPDGLFATITSAETLEHVEDDRAAVAELARTLAPGGVLVGTVPADPGQWSDWDEWADHKRRYTRDAMEELLLDGGLAPRVTLWGWPLVRLYDDLFLRRVNRRRLRSDGPAETDPGLRRVAGLGQRRWLVRLVAVAFGADRLFDGAPWGVGLLFRGAKSTPIARTVASSDTTSQPTPSSHE
jgi:SAM-dependent methyltransferase